MSFDMNTLTLKGAELLAASTVQNRLILDGCDAAVGFIDQNTAVNISARPSSPLSTTTDVSIIGSTAEHVMARAQWTEGQQTGGNANTLYLYGHNEQSPSNIYVIYICSSQSTFHLPTVGDVTPVFEALFDMIYACTLNSVTTASTSVYATLAEFNTLKERTVTTHKEQQATVGENQTIYGDKTFKGSVIGNSILPETSSGNIGASNNRFANVYSTSSDFTSLTCPTINFDSTGLRKIYADGPLKLGMGPDGTGEERYQTRSEFGTNLFEIAAERCDSQGEELDWSYFAMRQDKNSSNQHNGDVRMNVSNRTEFKLEYNSTTDVSACTLDSDSITMEASSDVFIYANQAKTIAINMHSSSISILTPTSNGYEIELQTGKLTINASKIQAISGLTPDIGTNGIPFGNAYFTGVYCENVYSNSITVRDTGQQSNIGSSSYRYTNIYANNLYGKLPTPTLTGSGRSTSITEPGVGGFLLIYFEVDTVSPASMDTHSISAGSILKVGDTIEDYNTVTGTVGTIQIASINSSGEIRGGMTALGGTYKTLCHAQMSAVGASTTMFKGTALAIRIE